MEYVFEIHGGTHSDIHWEHSLPYLLEGCATTSVEEESAQGNLAMRVLPNPVDGLSRIEFSLAEASAGVLVFYQVGGKAIRTLELGRLERGTHTVEWDGLDDQGRSIGPGVYFAHLRVNGGPSVSRKLIVVR